MPIPYPLNYAFAYMAPVVSWLCLYLLAIVITAVLVLSLRRSKKRAEAEMRRWHIELSVAMQELRSGYD